VFGRVYFYYWDGLAYILTACNYSYIQLIDFNARFYSPRLGRFIQPDSIIPDLTNPQSLNLFSYVLNSPLLFIDPSGHMYIEESCGRLECIGNEREQLEVAIMTEEYSGSDGLLSEWDSNFGIEFDGSWSNENKNSIREAVLKTGEKIGEGLRASDAFKSVYGDNFTFSICGQGVGPGCNNNYRMKTIDSNHITYNPSVGFYPSWMGDYSRRNVRLVIHEFGHAFNKAVCDIVAVDATICSGSIDPPGSPYYDLGNSGLVGGGYGDVGTSFNGFAGGVDEWQFRYSEEKGEYFADMFLGWVNGNLGPQRADHMNSYMPGYLSILSP